MHLIIHIYKEAGTLCNLCLLLLITGASAAQCSLVFMRHKKETVGGIVLEKGEKQHLKQIHKVARGNVHGNHRHPHIQA